MPEYGFATVVSPDTDDALVATMCSDRLRKMAERDGYVLTSEPRLVGSELGWLDPDDPASFGLPMEFAPLNAKPNVKNVRWVADVEPA